MNGRFDAHQRSGYLIGGFHAFHTGKFPQRRDRRGQVFQAVHLQAEGGRQRVFFRVLLKTLQEALAAQRFAQLVQGVLLADILPGGDIGHILNGIPQHIGADAAQIVFDPDHHLVKAFDIPHQGIDIQGKHQRAADQHHAGDQHADGSHRHLPVGTDIAQALPDQIAKGIFKHGRHLPNPG